MNSFVCRKGLMHLIKKKTVIIMFIIYGIRFIRMLHVPVVLTGCSWFWFVNIVNMVVLSKMETIHDIFRKQIYQEFAIVYGNKNDDC